MTDSVELAEAKAAARTHVRERRQQRSSAEQRSATQALGRASAVSAVTTLLTTPVRGVASYLAMPGEPDLSSMHDQLHDAGVTLLFPRVGATPRCLEWARADDGVAIRQVAPRVPEPVGPALTTSVWTEVSVALIPALGIDHTGARLGQGGAYYDTILSEKPAHIPVIAVIFDDEFWQSTKLPTGHYDTAVDAVLTPTVFRWVSKHPLAELVPGSERCV